MLKSIYTPLSGALAQEKVLDIIANNLANVNTTGFKGESVTFKVLESEPEKNYKTPLPPANYKVGFGENGGTNVSNGIRNTLRTKTTTRKDPQRSQEI